MVERQQLGSASIKRPGGPWGNQKALKNGLSSRWTFLQYHPEIQKWRDETELALHGKDDWFYCVDALRILIRDTLSMIHLISERWSKLSDSQKTESAFYAYNKQTKSWQTHLKRLLALLPENIRKAQELRLRPPEEERPEDLVLGIDSDPDLDIAEKIVVIKPGSILEDLRAGMGFDPDPLEPEPGAGNVGD